MTLYYEVVILRGVTSGHYAAWGEDLVLAVRPGKNNPQRKAEGHGDMHWAGRELSLATGTKT